MGCQNGSEVLYLHAKFGGDQMSHASARGGSSVFFIYFLLICF